MQASSLEIYNETIRDLLSNRPCGIDQTRTDNSVPGKQYKLVANGNTHVSDLTIVDVCSVNKISSLLKQAAQCRSVGRTQMNEQSSGSHFVFTLRICGILENTEQQANSDRAANSDSHTPSEGLWFNQREKMKNPLLML
ncbi:kinesin-like protein KIN-14C [Arachis hypogaea]|uniref:kinesin-like protein KIN-14C n=1 Tax=Arachis hypogaea TaxID=3818 RepID=UPI0034E76C70|nr:Kinesin-like protein [Arachis hypogaea]